MSSTALGAGGPAAPARRIAGTAVDLLEGWPAAIVLLLARLWMASIFLRAGLLKLRDFGSTVFLFTEVHPVPLLPPVLAATMATAVELACPVLLVLGLATRLVALPMLAMVLVIQFVVGAADPAFRQDEHYAWMLLLAVLVCAGPGRLSLDRQLVTPRWGVPT